MAPGRLTSASPGDVYSLGVVLYVLVAGVTPFGGQAFGEIAMNVLTTPAPPLEQAVPGIPLPVARVVARCLSKEPRERFASAAELGAALEPFRRRPSADDTSWAPGGLAPDALGLSTTAARPATPVRLSTRATSATPVPSVRARPRPAPSTADGYLDLACSPVPCAVVLDGSAIGETPLLRHPVRAGLHTVDFINLETRGKVRRQLQVAPGAKVKVPVKW